MASSGCPAGHGELEATDNYMSFTVKAMESVCTRQELVGSKAAFLIRRCATIFLILDTILSF